MRYHQPYGVTDENAPYINGDPSIARQGSIIPAEAVEFPQREAVALIEGAKLTPDDANLSQMLYAVRSQRMNYALAIASGSADIVAVEFDPPVANTMTPGMPLRIKAIANNTGPAQLSTDGILHALRHADGSELVADEIKNGVVFGAVWNDTGYWEFNSYMGGGGGGGGGGTVNNTYNVNIPYTVDTGTPNALVAPFVPAITALTNGLTVEVLVINDITGPSTIVVNNLAPVPILRGNGQPLQNGDATSGQIMLLIYSALAAAFQFSGLIPKPVSNLGPVGNIILTPANAPFPGTLKLNGAMLVRAEHPLLWAYAAASGRIVNEADWQNLQARSWTAFSRGDDSTTFRLPDFRGEFLRWWDDGRGVDIGRLLGGQQTHQVGEMSFNGTMTCTNVVWYYFNSTNPNQGVPNYWGYGVPIIYTGGGGGEGPIYGLGGTQIGSAPLTGFSGQASMAGNSGLETRTRNIVVIPCIVDG